MYSTSVDTAYRSFNNTINNMARASIDIEKASISNKYTNKDLLHYEDSEMGINLYDNILMNKYFEKIKATCTKKTLTKEEQIKYNYRPELLSTDTYNTPQLWYLIMKVNNCEDFSDFRNLNTVLLPDLSTVENCLTNEEYILSKNEY